MSNKKILISGPGRSGTSFLIQLLTRTTGLTGYEPYKEPVSDEVRAGGEWKEYSNITSLDDLKDKLQNCPTIIKSPSIPLYLKPFLLGGYLELAHCIIPVREHYDAAESRMGVDLHWPWAGKDLDSQAQANDIILGRTVEACILADVPITFTKFPRVVLDCDYCYTKVSIALEDIGVQIEPSLFHEKFKELSRPDLVAIKEENRKRTFVIPTEHL